jgi:iron complex transport system substrate-binding protein
VSAGQFRDTDAAVALGTVPLATPDISLFIPGSISPWVLEKLAGQQPPAILANVDGLPFERIAGLRPDLILATDDRALDEDYVHLSAIAPTLSSRDGYNKDVWQVTTSRIGQLLGRADAAAALVAQVEGAIAAARADNPGFAGRTFTIGPVTADGQVNTINSTTDASVVFMAQLGLKLSPRVTALPTSSIPGRAVISAEQLSQIDADVMLLTFNTPQARERLEGDTLFQRIPAVQRGSYVPLELPTAIAIGFPSALSIPYALRQSVPAIATALTRQ